MRRWDHRNWLPAHIDPKLQTGLENVRKTFTQKRLGLVRNVQINALRTAAFDLRIDCARHYIAGGQRATRVISRHEILAPGITQDSPFAADCFRNQKRTLFGVEEAGGMELNKFHVRDGDSGAPCHGHPVARRNRRIRGVEINLPASPGSQHYPIASN